MKGLGACELIFFDPDNGLEVKSVAKGRKTSNKYVYLDEIAGHYADGRSVLLYQHFPRHVPRETLVGAATGRLRSALTQSTVWRFETPHVVFLLAARPDHVARVEAVADAFHQRYLAPGLFGRVELVAADVERN